MRKLLDELYLEWLYDQVADTKMKSPIKTYWKLLRQLYTKEFVWFVPNDDNRIEDGKDLRYEFIDQAELDDVDLSWVDLGCSMLELLVGLARRMDFESERFNISGAFWQLIDNLEIRADDTRRFPDKVNQALENVIYRTYDWNGHGGLFPLQHPAKDQRDVELWYQLSAYILENEY